MRTYVARVMTIAGGNVTEAARLSGMDASNFRRLVRRIHDEKSVESFD